MNKIVVCNWKMNGNVDFCKQVNEYFANHKFNNVDIIIAPPSPFFSYLNQNLKICSQNCAIEKSGPYTGEIGVDILNDLEIKYTIIGHSERRKYFYESHDVILSKISHVIEGGITPIICVKRFSEDQSYIREICGYLSNFAALNKNKKIKIIIAYEPDSSIGTGIPDSLYSIEENCLKLKETFSVLSKDQISCDVLYGGSVDSKSVEDIIKICDGVLLGKASLDLNVLDTILNITDKIMVH